MGDRERRAGACANRFGLIGLLAAVLCLGGCGSANGYSSDSSSQATAAAENTSGYATDDIYEADYDMEEALEEGAGENGQQVASNRKLIRTVHMSVETEEFDVLAAKLEQRVAALGGYVENMDVYNGSGRNGQRSRYASLVARIPKEKLDMFVSEVSEMSNVVSKSESTEDVTLSYVDLESRKKALQVEQERLLELLGQAVSMEDIIAIEERISQVRYQLESMESQLRTYDNLVDFSTVYLSVDEVEVLTPVEEISDLARMAQGFVHSVGNLLDGIKEFLIGLVINLPYLIFIVLLVILAVKLVRGFSKKSRKKRDDYFRNVVENLEMGEQEAGQADFGPTDAGNRGFYRPEEKNGYQEPKANGIFSQQEADAGRAGQGEDGISSQSKED